MEVAIFLPAGEGAAGVAGGGFGDGVGNCVVHARVGVGRVDAAWECDGDGGTGAKREFEVVV